MQSETVIEALNERLSQVKKTSRIRYVTLRAVEYASGVVKTRVPEKAREELERAAKNWSEMNGTRYTRAEKKAVIEVYNLALSMM